LAPMQVFTDHFAPLTTAARQQSLSATLSARPNSDGELWVFGYGSLMWEPGFAPTAVEPARLDGWHRAMCVWTALARGTPACPGLSLGLMPGGSCQGLALRIADASAGAALDRLWQREMWTDVYRPFWSSATAGGREIAVLAFVANPESRQFAGALPPTKTVEHIALAHGQRGPCRDYLYQTVEKLQALGISDRDLEALTDAVTSHGKTPKSDCSPASR